MADTLESLEIEVKHSASGADTEINNVAASVRSLKASLSGVAPQMHALATAAKAINDGFKGGSDKYKKFADAMADIAASAELLKDNASSISALSTAMTAIASVKVTAGSFNSLANGIQKVGDAAKAVTPESIENLDKMVASLAKLQGVDLQGLGSAMSAVRRGGTSAKADVPVGPVPVELREIIETSNEIDVLRAKLEALRAALDEAFASGNTDKAYALRGQIIQTEKALQRAEDAARKAAEGIDEVGKSANKSSGALGNFISSLKRIAFYRFVRTIIKELTEAFKEGLENAYEYSKVMGGELAPALDRIATASQQMKNQLGAALGELIVSLEPLIVELIHLITLLAQAFTWLFATMEGRSEYLVANEVATSWKKADKAAKDYKRTILGFDVINRLNGPSGGNGDNNDYSTMFHYEPTGSLGEFKWQDITPFFKPLDDWVDATLDGLYELVDLLDRIFNGNYELNLNFGWNVDPIPILEKVKQWLNDLVAPNPYTVQVAVEVFDPQPQLDAVLEKVRGFLDETLNSTVTIMEKLRATVSEKVAQTSAATQTAFEKMREGITTALEKARGNATTVYEKLRTTLVTKTMQMKQKVSEEYQNLKTSIGTALTNARTNVTTFVKSTASALGQWARNSAESARAAFVNIAQNVYLGLTNAGENIATFVNTTASNIWSWASSTASNIVEWATGVANSIGEALSSAWESFKSFMEATGEKVSSWWSRNKTWVVPVAIGAAVTVAAVALAPATGGASLGALAFAANGGTFPNNGSLLVAGEAGPEIVANLGNSTGVMNVDQMRSAIRDGMLEAILASNRDGKTELHVYLDSREIKYGQSRLSRAMGV